MANETPKTEGAPKKKRAAFTRTVKPVYAILTYTQDGDVTKLDPANLTIQIERDADKILAMALGGPISASAVVKVDLPQPATRKPAAEAPAAA